MRYLEVSLLAVLVLFLSRSETIAETVNADVKANRSTMVYRFIIYDRTTCAAMRPAIMDKAVVDHGTISSSPLTIVMDRGNCKGKKFKGIALTYTPNRGFRGKDLAKVTLKMNTYSHAITAGFKYHRVKLNLNVD